MSAMGNGGDNLSDRCSPHGWTLDTLEEHLSQRIRSLSEFTVAEQRSSKEAVSAALSAVKEQSSAAMAAAERAINKSEQATEKRFDSVNEFRKTLADQAAGFLSRAEYEANYRSLAEKIGNLQSRVDARDGQITGISSSWGFVIGVVGIVYGVVSTVGVAVVIFGKLMH